ncbi:MAG: glycosyltransferase family 2 protein [Chitinophagaceae bacterium]|nr:glycosyltransferase family 2 protein [Chitinophagaceae bacterium]
MKGFSIVIICKNEADIIANTLQNLEGITDDIVVYDNGSTDGTIEIVRQHAVHLHQGKWEGFGKTKNKANALAKYDWILSLDADESMDEELKRSLLESDPPSVSIAYEMKFKNFLGNKFLRHGEWGRDDHIRFFNRTAVTWNDAPVHEELLLPVGSSVKKLKGYVLHQTMKDMQDYGDKMTKYAMMNAEKYYQLGKKASWFKIRFAPGFAFIQNYILRLGFLDGHAGYVCARMTAYYTFLKYARLRELTKGVGSSG